MPPTFDAQAMLSHYAFSPDLIRRLEFLGNAGGWSGSRLWRVRTVDNHDLCLRCWPGEWRSADRLRFIHEVLTRVTAGGLTVVPVPLRSHAGEPFVEHQGRFWELTPWMPGEADYHARPSRERLRSAMQTLARFHDLAIVGQVPRVAHNMAPALVVRSNALRDISQQSAELSAQLCSGLGVALDLRAARLLELIRNRAAELVPRVVAAAQLNWFLQPAIRDIWHDHVLFTGSEVTGIVDFGALRVDTPLTDVARLLGSLAGDDQDARQFALDAYAELRSLCNRDRELIELLDRSGVVVAGINWLTWLYVERRDMGPEGPIVRRLDEILARLERN